MKRVMPRSIHEWLWATVAVLNLVLMAGYLMLADWGGGYRLLCYSNAFPDDDPIHPQNH